MRRARWLLPAVMAVVVLAGIVPAHSARPKLLTLSFCTGDGRLQIIDFGAVGDDVWFLGRVGCLIAGGDGQAYPVDVEAIPTVSTVGYAGACTDGIEAPLEKLRMRVKLTLTMGKKTYTSVRTLSGGSDGNFPGSNINGRVTDPTGYVGMGRFRFEPFASWYCASDFSYLRLYDVVFGPAAGLPV